MAANNDMSLGPFNESTVATCVRSVSLFPNSVCILEGHLHCLIWAWQDTTVLAEISFQVVSNPLYTGPCCPWPLYTVHWPLLHHLRHPTAPRGRRRGTLCQTKQQKSLHWTKGRSRHPPMHLHRHTDQEERIGNRLWDVSVHNIRVCSRE